jgi:hypothetical protein
MLQFISNTGVVMNIIDNPLKSAYQESMGILTKSMLEIITVLQIIIVENSSKIL